MTLTLSHTTVDARDPYAQALWWCEMAEFTPKEGVQPGSAECYVVTEDGHTILFIQVPDAKTVKNRLHFCMRPRGLSQDAEVERALALGAGVVTDFRPSGGWVVMADPEGNEFCILADRPTTGEPPAKESQAHENGRNRDRQA